MTKTANTAEVMTASTARKALAAAAGTGAEAVADARSEAADAHATVDALVEKIRDGDTTVTPAVLAEHRDLARFADLRVEAAERKADVDARQARQQQLAVLREQITAADTAIGPRLADLLLAYQDAADAFLAEAEQWNANLAGWTEAVHALGVRDRSKMAPGESRDNGGLGFSEATGAVTAPGVHAAVLAPGPYLRDALAEVARRGGRSTSGVNLLNDGGMGSIFRHLPGDDPIGRLRNLK